MLLVSGCGDNKQKIKEEACNIMEIDERFVFFYLVKYNEKWKEKAIFESNLKPVVEFNSKSTNEIWYEWAKEYYNEIEKLTREDCNEK